MPSEQDAKGQMRCLSEIIPILPLTTCTSSSAMWHDTELLNKQVALRCVESNSWCHAIATPWKAASS